MRDWNHELAPDRRQAPSALLRELAALGCEPCVATRELGLVAGGTGLCLPVRELLADADRLARDLERVRGLLTQGSPVGISLVDIGRLGDRRLEWLLRRLRRATAAACIDRRLLALAIPGGSLPAWLFGGRAWLGAGARFILLEHATAADPAGAWSALYAQRARPHGLAPAFTAAVRSACPLLPDEHGRVPTTALALMAPPATAWLPLRVDLRRHADAGGRIGTPSLHARLAAALGIADRLFDCIHWADRAQRHDARDHRRIVFVLEGLGDLLRLRGADPAAIGSLRRLDELVGGIRDCLWQASRALARERGCLPALARRNPGNALANARERQAWRQRWDDALADVAVRHRNLLAISPRALLPATGPSGTDWFDLLPLLAHADVIGARGGAAPHRWSASEFRTFYRRVRAVLERRNAAALVAGGV